jgi:hypothetical protein
MMKKTILILTALTCGGFAFGGGPVIESKATKVLRGT